MVLVAFKIRAPVVFDLYGRPWIRKEPYGRLPYLLEFAKTGDAIVVGIEVIGLPVDGLPSGPDDAVIAAVALSAAGRICPPDLHAPVVAVEIELLFGDGPELAFYHGVVFVEISLRAVVVPAVLDTLVGSPRRDHLRGEIRRVVLRHHKGARFRSPVRELYGAVHGRIILFAGKFDHTVFDRVGQHAVLLHAGIVEDDIRGPARQRFCITACTEHIGRLDGFHERFCAAGVIAVMARLQDIRLDIELFVYDVILNRGLDISAGEVLHAADGHHGHQGFVVQKSCCGLLVIAGRSPGLIVVEDLEIRVPNAESIPCRDVMDVDVLLFDRRRYLRIGVFLPALPIGVDVLGEVIVPRLVLVLGVGIFLQVLVRGKVELADREIGVLHDRGQKEVVVIVVVRQVEVQTVYAVVLQVPDHARLAVVIRTVRVSRVHQDIVPVRFEKDSISSHPCIPEVQDGDLRVIAA